VDVSTDVFSCTDEFRCVCMPLVIETVMNACDVECSSVPRKATLSVVDDANMGVLKSSSCTISVSLRKEVFLNAYIGI